MGKHYPGESLPRWALDVVGAPGRRARSGSERGGRDAPAPAGRVRARWLEAIARRLGVSPDDLHARLRGSLALRCSDEAELPVDVDPLKADLDDPEERRRLARRPRARARHARSATCCRSRASRGRWTTERVDASGAGTSSSSRATARSACGCRCSSLGGPARSRRAARGRRARPIRARGGRRAAEKAQRQDSVAIAAARPAPPAATAAAVRTALCVEPRDGELRVFLPPLAHGRRLLRAGRARSTQRAARPALDVRARGLPAAADRRAAPRFAVTPDPGVLEVNLPPGASAREHAGAARARCSTPRCTPGLHAEKYLARRPHGRHRRRQPPHARRPDAARRARSSCGPTCSRA